MSREESLALWSKVNPHLRSSSFERIRGAERKSWKDSFVGHEGAAWAVTHFGPSGQPLFRACVSLRFMARDAPENTATGFTGLGREMGTSIPYH